VPIRTARLTGAGSQPCAAASLPAVDSNHDHPRPEHGVLPVGPAGISTGGASRTRIPRGLSSRGLPVASLPRAPPEARTPFPGVRAQCITRHACGAQSGPPRIRTGKPSPCKGVALPIGASSPCGCLLSGDRQPEQAFTRCAHPPPGIDPPRLIAFHCAVVNPQARAPIGWCLAYVRVHKNRPPGVSPRAASGRRLHLYPEASPASGVRHGCKNAGMTRCLSSRSRG
jgi:hypothetical protein